jgi:NADH:ubiquinone oxidoreductase subunit 3 (subunit A)
MNIYIAFAIIIGVMVVLGVVAVVVFITVEARNKSKSTKSMPKGADSTSMGRMLQDKYKEERDSGEFKRPDFY